MKNFVIYIGISLIYLNQVDAQAMRNLKYPIPASEITNRNIKMEIKNYIKRNFMNREEKGIVTIKLSNPLRDTANFEFYISEKLLKSTLPSLNPTAFCLINKRLVLLYGSWDGGFLIKKNNRAYSYKIQKYLINDDINYDTKDGQQTGDISFDPENLKVVVKNSSIFSKTEE